MDRLLPRRAVRPEPPGSGSSEIGGGENETSRKGCLGAVIRAPRDWGARLPPPTPPPQPPEHPSLGSGVRLPAKAPRTEALWAWRVAGKMLHTFTAEKR